MSWSTIFQTMNSVRSNNISLKYQIFTTLLGFKDIGVIKSEFVANTQFLWIESDRLIGQEMSLILTRKQWKDFRRKFFL